tara:strand:+ start:5955 stop:7067 length:1113 start_codon:yes stop_codon:yes gene_type:complete
MEIHFVYGSIAAKNFILPISKSCLADSIVYYQMSNRNDLINIKGIKPLPYWFNLKISPKLNIYFLIKSMIYIYKILKKHNGCSVIAHMTTFSFFPLLIAKLANIKVRIYFNHGFAHIGSKGLNKIFLFSLEFFSCLIASKVVTVSPSHLKHIKKGFLGNLSLIKSTKPGSCSGIDLKNFISLNELNKKSFNLGNEKNIIYLSYIGRPYKRKGFPYIIEIFENLKNEIPTKNIILQIIGIKKTKVFKALKDKNNMNYIKVIEHTDDVYIYLRRSVITILPSLREGFGYALLEGGASGNALATFNMIGPDSLVKNNVNGILIPYGSNSKIFARKISEIINDTRKLKNLMNNSRKYAMNFDKNIVLSYLRKII